MNARQPPGWTSALYGRIGAGPVHMSQSRLARGRRRRAGSGPSATGSRSRSRRGPTLPSRPARTTSSRASTRCGVLRRCVFDLHHAAVPARGGEHGLALDHVDADRLLDVDVGPGPHGLDHRQRVPVVGRRDEHDVEVALGRASSGSPRTSAGASSRPGGSRRGRRRRRASRSRRRRATTTSTGATWSRRSRCGLAVPARADRARRAAACRRRPRRSGRAARARVLRCRPSSGTAFSACGPPRVEEHESSTTGGPFRPVFEGILLHAPATRAPARPGGREDSPVPPVNNRPQASYPIATAARRSRFARPLRAS